MGAHSVPRMLQLGRRQMAAMRVSYAAPTFLSFIHDRGGTSQFIVGLFLGTSVARRSQEGYPGNAVRAYQFLCARLLLTLSGAGSFAISACVRYVQARREVPVGEQAGGRPCLLACSCPSPLVSSAPRLARSSRSSRTISSEAMSQALVPREGSDFAVALDTLALNFSLAPEVVAKLKQEGLANLEELRFLFDSEEHVGRWVAKLSLGDATLLNTARLHRAWSAVRLYFTQSEKDRSKVALADLDSLLEDSELRDVKVAFWKRYHMRYPSEMHPADSLLSRLSRELSKRMLCVYDVWKVRSLHFQLTTVQKKRKLGDNLFTEEVETAEVVSKRHRHIPRQAPHIDDSIRHGRSSPCARSRSYQGGAWDELGGVCYCSFGCAACLLLQG